MGKAFLCSEAKLETPSECSDTLVLGKNAKTEGLERCLQGCLCLCVLGNVSLCPQLEDRRANGAVSSVVTPHRFCTDGPISLISINTIGAGLEVSSEIGMTGESLAKTSLGA